MLSCQYLPLYQLGSIYLFPVGDDMPSICQRGGLQCIAHQYEKELGSIDRVAEAMSPVVTGELYYH